MKGIWHKVSICAGISLPQSGQNLWTFQSWQCHSFQLFCLLSSLTLFVNKTECFADTNSTFQKWRKWQFGRFCTVFPEHYESLNPSMKGKIDHIEVTKWEKNAKLKQVKNVCLCLISVLTRKWMKIAWISATLSQQLRPLKI